MAYQRKEPCLPPPMDIAQQCVRTCDCPPSQVCRAPNSHSCQTKQPCAAPSFGVVRCPTATFAPRASPCLSAHTEMRAESSSIPRGSGSLQPCTSCPDVPQPCSLGTAEACAPPSPPKCAPSCSDNCSDPEHDVVPEPYVVPGSIVCLEPSGSVSVKPGVCSPELEDNVLILASYKPHF